MLLLFLLRKVLLKSSNSSHFDLISGVSAFLPLVFSLFLQSFFLFFMLGQILAQLLIISHLLHILVETVALIVLLLASVVLVASAELAGRFHVV